MDNAVLLAINRRLHFQRTLVLPMLTKVVLASVFVAVRLNTELHKKTGLLHVKTLITFHKMVPLPLSMGMEDRRQLSSLEKT